jgi:hypothetical protein
MGSWWRRLFGAPGTVDDRVPALEREAGELRLVVKGLEETLGNLKQALRDLAARARDEAVHGELAGVVEDLAVPITQLHTQEHLLAKEGKPVGARDVLTVANQVIHLLEDRGLALEGTVGEEVPYDPDRHEPLRAADRPAPGAPVVIRFAGVVWRGQVVKRAGVEQA